MSRTGRAGALRTFGTRVLAALGVPADDAALVADSLVQADLWGHQSHGFLRLPWYVARLRSGAMRAVTDPAVLVRHRPAASCSTAATASARCSPSGPARLAVERARTHGVGVVGVRNSNHFGTAMYWTRRAAARRLRRRPHHEREPGHGALGRPGEACSAPTRGRSPRPGRTGASSPSTSRTPPWPAARSTWPKNRGEPIPETWALTADGAPTTDPAEGVLGVILPMAGHKGYAITFLMDVLSGALTGSAVGTGVHGPYEAGRAAAARATCSSPSTRRRSATAAGYEARVRQLIDEVKDVPLAQGFDEVFYPGEVEDRAEAANLAAGGVAPRRAVPRRPAHAGGRDRRAVPGGGRDDRHPPRRARPTWSTARLKEEIELGELAPGTPLSELSLVERTGASRTPVREALRRLAAEGLVDLVPRQGARVSRVSLQSVRDLFDFRALLEPAAVRQATEAAAADPQLRRDLHGDAHRVRPHPAPAAVAGAVAGVLRAGRPVRLGGHRRDPQRAPAAHHRRAAPAHRAAAQPLARRPAAGRRLGGRAPGHLRRAAARATPTRPPRGPPSTWRRASRRSSATWRRRPAAASTCSADGPYGHNALSRRP